MDEGNACIILLKENCQDRAGDQSRGEDDTVNSLVEDDWSWGHFVRHLLCRTTGVVLGGKCIHTVYINILV